jgi:hypothetical protein
VAVLRVDPAAARRKTHAREVGGYIGSLWGPVGGAIGTGAGWVVDKIFGKTKPARTYELDTDTGELEWVSDGSPMQRRALQVKMVAVERDLEEAWRTGVVPGTLPKKYRSGAALLVSERPTTTNAPEVSPPWSQYDMTAIIPPGGLQGFAQMTPASRLALTGGRLRGSKKRRKRSKKASPKRRKSSSKKRSSSSGKRKKLVKGSPAAKRFMANLRKRRK